jgi:general secretion pathway protein I
VKARSQEGFTLLEVLVAIIVLGVGVALTLSLISGALGNIRKVQLRARAVQHAETVMELTLLDDSIKGPTTLRGDFEDGTTWSVVVNEVTPPPPPMQTAGPQVAPPDLGIKILSYAVEVFDPGSQAPGFQLQTAKIVSNLDSKLPGGVRR